MGRVAKVIMTVVLLKITAFSTMVNADVKKGQNIFINTLKITCSTTGIDSCAKFTFKHTQNEWETIKQAGKFSNEVIKICPKASGKLKQQDENDVYHFSYEYASDSGNVPSC